MCCKFEDSEEVADVIVGNEKRKANKKLDCNEVSMEYTNDVCIREMQC